MNRTNSHWKFLVLLTVLVMAGCADQPADPQPVADPGNPPGALELAESEYGPLETGSESPPTTIEPARVEVGAKAPDFEATGLDGEAVSLSDYLGEQNVVVAFSRANW